MATNLKCRECGDDTFRGDTSDSLCDRCRERVYEEAQGPPEFVAGIRAYKWGRHKLASNPYWDGTPESELTSEFQLFNNGYDWAKEQDK